MADDNEFKVYVGSLNFKTVDEGLEDFFKDCGKVVGAQVIIDRDSGRSRGFGFVTFQDHVSFEKALELHGKELDGRKVTVSKANARTGGGGGGRSGGGGFRGGRRDYGQDRGGGQYRGGDQSSGKGGRTQIVQGPLQVHPLSPACAPFESKSWNNPYGEPVCMLSIRGGGAYGGGGSYGSYGGAGGYGGGGGYGNNPGYY